MQVRPNALLCPKPDVLVRMQPRDLEEIQWYAEMGMPVSGSIVRVIERVTKNRRVRKEAK